MSPLINFAALVVLFVVAVCWLQLDINMEE
jgi:hypothetical protein